MKKLKKLCLLFGLWPFLVKKLSNILKYLNTPWRKIIFILSSAALFLIIFLLISLLRVSQSEIALAELKESFKREPICHEECYLWRENKENIIGLDLKNGSVKLEKRLVTYWYDQAENFDFKKELVRIAFLAYGRDNLPAYLGDYLTDPKADQRLVREISTNFYLNPQNNQNLLVSLAEAINNAASSTEKIEAIKTLGKVGGDSEIDNYFLLLNSSEDLPVKLQAIKNISNILEKSKYFTSEQLEKIRDLILTSEIEADLRRELVLLVGDYYLVYPEESAAIWKEVSENTNLDSISRLFSSDNLNHLAGTKLELPAVSPEEWADYYNQ